MRADPFAALRMTGESEGLRMTRGGEETQDDKRGVGQKKGIRARRQARTPEGTYWRNPAVPGLREARDAARQSLTLFCWSVESLARI